MKCHCFNLTGLFFSLILTILVGMSTAGAENVPGSPALAAHTYQIKISVSERKLYLYQREGTAVLNLLRKYDIATAIRGLDPVPLGFGRITKIEFNPRWYPPPITRAIFKAKGINLPTVVKPGDPLNFMGAFKIYLSHCTSRGCFYRIHGNNDKSKIGKRVTGGCVRMYNEEGLELARKVSVGTEVIIVP